MIISILANGQEMSGRFFASMKNIFVVCAARLQFLQSQNMVTPHDILLPKVLRNVLVSIKSKAVKVLQDFKVK